MSSEPRLNQEEKRESMARKYRLTKSLNTYPSIFDGADFMYHIEEKTLLEGWREVGWFNAESDEDAVAEARKRIGSLNIGSPHQVIAEWN
jgi:hypothetical protein